MNRRLSWAFAALCLTASGCKSLPDDIARSQARPAAKVAAKVQQTASTPTPESVLDLPVRRADALDGRAFMLKIAGLPVHKRERAMVDEILRGNVPSHLRSLAPLRLGSVYRDGARVPVIAWVMRDYAAIGSDKDYVHVPLSYDAIMRLCAATNMALPTRRIVDFVYSRATVRLTPRPLPASRAMSSISYLLRHDDAIQAELLPRLAAVGSRVIDLSRSVIAGHKKDVVASKRLVRRPDRLAIFGWHQRGAAPIQPLSLAHERGYADYSHGIRLLAHSLKVGKDLIDLERAFKDPELAALVSDEGLFPTFAAVAGLK